MAFHPSYLKGHDLPISNRHCQSSALHTSSMTYLPLVRLPVAYPHSSTLVGCLRISVNSSGTIFGSSTRACISLTCALPSPSCWMVLLVPISSATALYHHFNPIHLVDALVNHTPCVSESVVNSGASLIGEGLQDWFSNAGSRFMGCCSLEVLAGPSFRGNSRLIPSMYAYHFQMVALLGYTLRWG